VDQHSWSSFNPAKKSPSLQGVSNVKPSYEKLAVKIILIWGKVALIINSGISDNDGGQINIYMPHPSK
jgi:hypothetical protein